MRVRVLFFGILKDLAGKSSDSLDLPDGALVRDLLEHYASRVPRVREALASLAVAVNQRYAGVETELRSDDEVALLPPVSGGSGEAEGERSSGQSASGRRYAARFASIVRAPIDTQGVLDRIKQGEDGAAAIFEGVVRNQTRGRKTLYLDYEAYEEMALHQMEALAEQALKEFKIRDVAVVHRLGRLEIGETSVLIVVAEWKAHLSERTATMPRSARLNSRGGYPYVHCFHRMIRPCILVFLVLVCGAVACAQQAPAQTQSEGTLKVDVKLVNVYVTVTDAHGAPVAGLKKENFRVQEDGRDQTISVFDKESAVPLSIALAIDTSLSTRHDLPLEQASAKRFARAILRSVDALSVFGFSETVLQSTSYTADMHRIEEGIDHIRLGAATALFDAVYFAARSLDRRQGRKVMVLITDGGDTVSKMDYKEAARAAEEAEALVYSIIVVPIEASAGRETGGEHALIQLSEDTGGRYYYATSMAQLDEAFRQISDELRTQYLLAYYPSQRLSNSQFRRIQVGVTGAAEPTSYHVRHRAGYYTTKSDF